ncbi:hypothetical protein [Pseudocnuella soli]|uniref:hypothetical protein n=1 Tax=Pseudocnuella soli TaxID=2502779 RepID=UPI00104BBA55|nr:hypothetical protein [Pseudocnuella soli]
MTFKITYIFALAFSLMVWLSGSAQQTLITNPLTTFFQANFDSTIIYHNWSSWNPLPNYCIIAKKDNGTFLFTYRSPYHSTFGHKFPSDLTEKFIAEQLLFERTQVDTNRYFLPVQVDLDDKRNTWKYLNANRLWNLKNVDRIKKQCSIEDGLENTFYLITSGGTKILHFDESDLSQLCAPTFSDRQYVLTVTDQILVTFKCR